MKMKKEEEEEKKERVQNKIGMTSIPLRHALLGVIL